MGSNRHSSGGKPIDCTCIIFGSGFHIETGKAVKHHTLESVELGGSGAFVDTLGERRAQQSCHLRGGNLGRVGSVPYCGLNTMSSTPKIQANSLTCFSWLAGTCTGRNTFSGESCESKLK